MQCPHNDTAILFVMKEYEDISAKKDKIKRLKSGENKDKKDSKRIKQSFC